MHRVAGNPAIAVVSPVRHLVFTVASFAPARSRHYSGLKKCWYTKVKVGPWRRKAKALVGLCPARLAFLCVSLSIKRFLMPNGQLQLGFESLSCIAPPRSRERQISRAHWRFGRMRQAVEQPWDWEFQRRSLHPRAWMPDEAKLPQVTR